MVLNWTKREASNPEPIKIIIADDHGIMREALRNFLQQQEEFEVIAEAGDSFEVLEQCQLCDPDVVIMDIAMHSLDGIQCVEKIAEVRKDIRTLILTGYDDAMHLKQALLAGAKGYLLKKSFSEDLKLALLTVYRNGIYIDAEMIEKLLLLITNDDEPELSAVLSEREVQVISLIAKGLSLKEVSTQLKISVKTVETYKARSLEKLNLRSRAELIRYALEHGWLRAGS